VVPIPGWSWWKPWKWPEYVLRWLRGWYEVREARYKADKAKVDLEEAVKDQELADREREISAMVRKIRKLQNEYQAQYPGRHVVPQIVPAREDNPEIFQEAMRRLEEQARANQQWPPRCR
jgi:hypothetical protein